MGFSLGGLVSDLTGGLIDFGMESELQEDAQAFSAQQFEKQKEHEIDMFGRESEYATARALEQYNRQRSLLQDSPGLQMKGLKSAGLNPILAATGGFKSPAGGALPIPAARASATAKGASTSSGHSGNIRFGQARLLHEQANLTSAQKAKVEKETEYVGTKTDIAEPVAQLMQAIAGLLEQSNIDRNTSRRIWEWLTEELPDVTKPLTKKQQVEMLDKAKRRFPQLKGVDNAKRNIFGVN